MTGPGTAAFAELAASLGEVIAAGRLAAGGGAGPLTEAEAISNAAVLLFGGIETTEGMIANALLHLLSSPPSSPWCWPTRAWCPRRSRSRCGWNRPQRSSTATRPPAPPRQRRHRSRRPDEVPIAGANRDPAVFGDPDAFDVRRPNAGRHLAFAHGPHFCLGAHLARLEAQVAVETVLARLRRLRLDGRHPSAPRGLVFRKPPRLRVRWDNG